jgi:hypothetical protein
MRMTSLLHVLSLGAGVQSTTVLMLAFEREIPCDAVIFADTGWEPQAVYDHLERLKTLAADNGLPIHIVSAGNIRDTERRKDFYDIPYYLLNEDGSRGMARRQCTHQLKIYPIRRKVRQLMKERRLALKSGAVVQYLGISWDELQRMKPADVRFIEHRFPLIDRRWTRADCVTYLDARGMTAPRSACIGCPYHTDREWSELKQNAPNEFADAVAFEREVQATRAGLRGQPFLHASRKPLDEVDFRIPRSGQQPSDAECEGLCGV